MITNMDYSSAIKEWSLLYPETRKTALLLCEGKSEADIIELSKTKNIYQLEKEIRRTKLPQKILVRLRSLTDEQKQLLANGNENTAKLVCFLAVIKTDRLLFEFMREVYADKISSGQAEILDKDFIIFFERKVSESAKIAKWTSANLNDIKNAYKRIITHAGLGKKQGDSFVLIRPICEKDELALIRKNSEIFADTMFLN